MWTNSHLQHLQKKHSIGNCFGYKLVSIFLCPKCPSPNLHDLMKHRDVSYLELHDWQLPTKSALTSCKWGYNSPLIGVIIPSYSFTVYSPITRGSHKSIKKRPVGAILRQRCRFVEGWLEKQTDCFWRGVCQLRPRKMLVPAVWIWDDITPAFDGKHHFQSQNLS